MILLILKEAFSSFKRNDDMSRAASMAFYSALALIPALFLITYVAGVFIGSSHRALLRIQELVIQFIPKYSEVIIKEVAKIVGLKKGVGILNILIFLWSVLPLSSSIRNSLRIIFRIEAKKPYIVEKLLDVFIMILFIIGIALLSIKDPVVRLIRTHLPFFRIPFYWESVFSVFVLFFLLSFLYWAFTFMRWHAEPKRIRHLAIGAAVATLMWFSMRPVFNLMLAYNPGYGLTFGSFKALFVVILWIYYSQIVFLFGAEIASALNRREAIILKKAILSQKGISGKGRGRYIAAFSPKEVIFNEGDPGDRMYYVLKGKVAIEKAGKVIAVIGEGRFFGEMSFLLSHPRTATARSLEDTELLTIDYKNLQILISEMPELLEEILREMASRLKETALLSHH